MFRVTTFSSDFNGVTKEQFFNTIEEAKSACTENCNLCIQYIDSGGKLRYRLLGFSFNGVYVSKV